MIQKEFLTNLLNENKEATIISSLGTISYDLDAIEHPHKICVRGAMGSVMSIGLGYSMALPERKVVVLIGDGAFLMKGMSLTTILKYNLSNLRIIIIDNGCHKSTGGQATNFNPIKNYISNIPNIEIWEDPS